MITWADVIIIAPELATAPLALQTEVLALANSYWHAEHFGLQRLRMLRMYTAAHFATLAMPGTGGPGAPSGSVISESADGLSVAYASTFNQPGFDPLWDGTSYGRQVRLLLSASGARGPFMF